jgi:thiol-disulfide isomerase/thioredoxin
MRKTKAEAIVAALLICNLFVSKSYASSQNSLVLRSITSATAKKEVVNFSDFDAISFFQENCHHCESQLRELACFKAKGLKTIAIGLGDVPLKLRQILNRNAASINGYAMDFALAGELGIKGTPVTFLRAMPTKELKRFDGLIRCKILEKPNYL